MPKPFPTRCTGNCLLMVLLLLSAARWTNPSFAQTASDELTLSRPMVMIEDELESDAMVGGPRDGHLMGGENDSQSFTDEFWTPPAELPSRPTVSPVTWSASTHYVALHRDDRLSLLFRSLGGQEDRINLGTEINSGFAVMLSRQSMRAGTRNGSETSIEVFQVSGDDVVDLPSAFAGRYAIDTHLTSVTADVGPVREVLGGEMFSAVGVRYLGMDDHYDLALDGFPSFEDFVATENHLILFNGRMGGRYSWRRWEFDAAFGGGVGGNFADQTGHWIDDQPAEFEPSTFELAITSELSAQVRRHLTDDLSVDVGFRGLYMAGVMVARESYGGPVDATDIRYAGATLGVRYEY